MKNENENNACIFIFSHHMKFALRFVFEGLPFYLNEGLQDNDLTHCRNEVNASL